ncbi:glutamate--tRNA ligase family protein [Pontibacter liquoris]|uniref:glutamate--tRNA ligase family protein n=1 Tax=Pontibacter liquoris TaxID=2905677 RepID=UPI001FA7EF0A|nr:glutamate--tRNA ligase family protein [Pontibacter liquoris]
MPQPIAPAVKTRIAPTPSGYLHLGNALSFALTWALARQQNGIVALRIDDLDNTRFRPAYLHDIFDTLQFLGLDYDEGPRDAEDFTRHYSQLQRLPYYNALLNQLVEQGLVYACTCSRSQIAALSPAGHYTRTCLARQLPLSTPGAAWRLHIPAETVIAFHDLLLGNCAIPLAEQMPDFVVRRKDGFPAYQVASLCDDLQMGVNLVVRGQDLLPSTAAQVHLAQCTGATAFTSMAFLHHPILHEPGGNKLSKSHDSLSVSELRRQGKTAADVWRLLARTLGWYPEDITDAGSFLARFRLADVPLALQQLQ